MDSRLNQIVRVILESNGITPLDNPLIRPNNDVNVIILRIPPSLFQNIFVIIDSLEAGDSQLKARSMKGIQHL